MLFSDLIFEAVIVDIDRSTGTCSLLPSSANNDAIITKVKLPNIAGTGNSGIFVGLSNGTRVIAVYTSGRSKESAAIVQTLPREELQPDIFDPSRSQDVRLGTQPYPRVREHETIIRGNKGAEIALRDNGDISTTVAGGAGSYLRKNGSKTSYTLVSESVTKYTQAGRSISGAVNRINPVVRAQSQREGLMELPLFADTFHDQLGETKGFFYGSPARAKSIGSALRNPALAEHKTIINEFSTDSMFTGFEDEVERLSGAVSLFESKDNFKRNREPGNSLHMAEHELVEIIGGNLIDIHGTPLDINYRQLSYGGAENKVPTKQVAETYDRAKRLSRRGVGYHFQLSTNTTKTDPSAYETNFAFDLDKEGIFKLNVPRSSNTGNIPFASLADYTDSGDNVNVSLANESKPERIPAILRDSKGEVLIPAGLNDTEEGRLSGLRFSNSRKNPYFPSQSDTGIATSVRVNTTRYHNMYAACERLFGTSIKRVNIPESFVNNYGIGTGNAVGKPFEILMPVEDQEGENGEGADAIANILDFIANPKELVKEILKPSNSDGYPQYMSTIGVSPSPPAIYPGGDTVVGGFIFDNDQLNPPFSNLFELEFDGQDFQSQTVDENGNPAIDPGGKSANVNLMGSLEMSIGKDNYDNKSLLLDTDGSIISWIGKDKNGRSIVTQTDGGVFVNIGGTYTDPDADEPQMNIGRFTMRVNITDKGFVDSQYDNNSTEEDTPSNPNAESDVLIDISQSGIIIAGMNSSVPMIIRNSGKILIESADNLVLKGNSVQIVESGGKAKNRKHGKR